jgi:hypothetical protein
MDRGALGRGPAWLGIQIWSIPAAKLAMVAGQAERATSFWPNEGAHDVRPPFGSGHDS